jgi:DNA-binding response OmpR family regulator
LAGWSPPIARSTSTSASDRLEAELAARVLLVEDETLIALLLEDMLEALGYTVVEVSAQLEAGLAAAERIDIDIDIAVLDVNLGGHVRSFPIADRLRMRGIPFLFTTGHGKAGLELAYPDAPVVQKPFRMSELRLALEQTLARRGR